MLFESENKWRQITNTNNNDKNTLRQSVGQKKKFNKFVDSQRGNRSGCKYDCSHGKSGELHLKGQNMSFLLPFRNKEVFLTLILWLFGHMQVYDYVPGYNYFANMYIICIREI